MHKAKIVSKHKRGTVEANLELRAGAQGTGKVIARVSYWPQHSVSVSAAYDALHSAAKREGYTVIYSKD